MNLFRKNNLFLLLLLFIVAAGALLRFWNYDNWSLSNDELSALNRLRFSSFSELIQLGVIPDYHPAGIQVFLWIWVKLFGNSPASVRLPFVLAGIASIPLIYHIGKKWFGSTTGLMAAASIAFLQYPLLYSRIARPYSTGLLFVLILTWSWTSLLMNKNTSTAHKWKKSAGLILGFTLCMYNHYYSFFFAAMAGLTGLFFLNKENYKYYLASCFASSLLFLPHLYISRIQLARGGLESWLGKPEADFLKKYLDFAFNESLLLQSVLIGMILLSVILYRKEWIRSRYRTICLAWFIIPLLFGYYYSVYINPILQFSILLFSFPFLLIFVFSFFTDTKRLVTVSAVTLFLSTGLYSTVSENNFYEKQFFGVFMELAEETVRFNKGYGETKVTTVLNVIHPWYMDYYFERMQSKISWHHLQGDDPAFGKKLLKIVNESTAEYFVYGWSNINNPPEAEWIILKKYYLAYSKKYFNSGISLYQNDWSVPPLPPVYYDKNDFDSNGKWGDNEIQQLTNEKYFSGNHSIRLDSTIEYSAGVTIPVSKLSFETTITLNVSVKINLPDTFHESQLVVSFEAGGKAYDWFGTDLKDWINTPGQWEEVFVAREILPPLSPDAVCKIYIWNSGKGVIYADDFVIAVYPLP